MQQEMKLRRRIAGGAMACVLSCGLMVPQLAFATPDSSSKQAEAQAVLASLNSMQHQLDQASADYGQALEEQAQAQQSADQAQERIDQINVEIADVQSRLGDRAQSMYRTGASSFLDLLLGSTSFSEFATNWDLLNKVNDNDAEPRAAQQGFAHRGARAEGHVRRAVPHRCCQGIRGQADSGRGSGHR